MHLAEELCHVRLFHEMLITCGLNRVKWVPFGAIKKKIYEQFPKLPDFLINAPAFVTELMGVTFYCHLDRPDMACLAISKRLATKLRETWRAGYVVGISK